MAFAGDCLFVCLLVAIGKLRKDLFLNIYSFLGPPYNHNDRQINKKLDRTILWINKLCTNVLSNIELLCFVSVVFFFFGINHNDFSNQ